MIGRILSLNRHILLLSLRLTTRCLVIVILIALYAFDGLLSLFLAISRITCAALIRGLGEGRTGCPDPAMSQRTIIDVCLMQVFM